MVIEGTATRKLVDTILLQKSLAHWGLARRWAGSAATKRARDRQGGDGSVGQMGTDLTPRMAHGNRGVASLALYPHANIATYG